VRATVRELQRIAIRESGGEIVIEVEGDGFLRHMVRAIVGTLAEVGAGTRTPASIEAMIRARDRQAGGATAPAQGLTLVAVRY
jgi:tRNA pseudouridine38-40 synthase